LLYIILAANAVDPGKARPKQNFEQIANVTLRWISCCCVCGYTLYKHNKVIKERLLPCKISINKIQKNIRERNGKNSMIEKIAYEVKVLRCKKTIPGKE